MRRLPVFSVDWNTPGETPRDKIQWAIDHAPAGSIVEIRFGSGFATELDAPVILRKKGIILRGGFFADGRYLGSAIQNSINAASRRVGLLKRLQRWVGRVFAEAKE